MEVATIADYQESVQADLRYLAQIDEWDHIKPFQIVGTLNSGQPRDNLVFETHRSVIHNARLTDPSFFSLATTGFEWVKHHTDEDMDTKNSIDRYIEAVTEFVSRRLKAQMVKTYQYQVRIQTSLPLLHC